MTKVRFKCQLNQWRLILSSQAAHNFQPPSKDLRNISASPGCSLENSGVTKRFLTVLISPAAMYLHDSMTAKGGQIHFDNQGLSKHIIMMWIKFLNSSEFLNPRPFGQILGDDQMPIDLGSPGHSLSRLIETVHHMAGGLFPSVNQASAKKGNLVFHTLRSCPQKGRPANKMLREEIF